MVVVRWRAADNGSATNLGKGQRLSGDGSDKGDDGIGAPRQVRDIGSSTMPSTQCSSETLRASARSYPTKVG
jgi:hypothetical protein